MNKSALIIGFLGRYNSGDELMLELHIGILKKLGFETIDLATEFPQDIERDYRHPIIGFDPSKDYDLVLIGGGALNAGFGFFPSLFFKFMKKSKVVMSSVNIPSESSEYIQILRNSCDLVICRNTRQFAFLRNLLPQLRYLPDVATCYRPQSTSSNGRVAIIIRQDDRAVINFRLKEDSEVLVLSRADERISKEYAERFGLPLRNLVNEMPQKHVDAVAEYDRVISVARFHAALYAVMLKKEFVYLFPNIDTTTLRTPQHVIQCSGTLAWEEVTALAKQHLGICKAGCKAEELAGYGIAEERDYIEAIGSIL